jgi:uridine kinase
MKNQSKVIEIRGAKASGKTTLADKIAEMYENPVFIDIKEFMKSNTIRKKNVDLIVIDDCPDILDVDLISKTPLLARELYSREIRRVYPDFIVIYQTK